MKKSIVQNVIAAALAAVTGLACAAPAAPASAASDPTSSTAVARVIGHAEKTLAAAQAAANKQLTKGDACRKLVRQGKIPATATAQYKCVLLGPRATLAAASSRALQPASEGGK